MMASLLRLAALIAAFFIYVQLSPRAPGNPALGIGLFLGSAIVFRLLSSFETGK